MEHLVLTKTGKVLNLHTIVEIDSKKETTNPKYKGVVFVHFANGAVYRFHTFNYIPSGAITLDMVAGWLVEEVVYFDRMEQKPVPTDHWERIPGIFEEVVK